MKTKYLHVLSAVALVAATLPMNAPAELLMILRGQPAEPTLFFELSGSTTVTNFSAGIKGLGGPLEDFDAFSPALGSVNFGRLGLLSGSASVINLTTASEVPITGLFLQDRTTLPSSEDRFGVETPVYEISAGDVIAWSGSGVLDLSQQGASFSDLTIGTGLSLRVAGPNPSGVARLTIEMIPEPATLTLLLPCAVILALALRRQWGTQKWVEQPGCTERRDRVSVDNRASSARRR